MEQAVIQPAVPPAPSICPVCHQPILPSYYFCPNCGHKIETAPLKTDTMTQLGIYAFSIILPPICFVFVTRWPGMKYFRSHDPKAKRIGEIAWTLLILSTIITLVLAIFWTLEAVQSSVTTINSVMSGS